MRTGWLVLAIGLASCSKSKATAPAGGSSDAALTADTAPTVLTAEQRKRDAAREPLAATVVDAYPNSNGFFADLGASWSPDGRQIIFGSTRDGVPEIYLADPAAPAAAPRALTVGPERAMWAGFTGDGRGVLFTRDHEGDENFAIWRVDLDGTNLTNLTPGETLHRDPPLVPRDRPTTILYQAATPASPNGALYRLDLAGGAETLVSQQSSPSAAIGVTADGARALMIGWVGNPDVWVDEIDVTSGKPRRLYPPAGQTTMIYAAAYAADDRSVYVAASVGNEVVLFALDLVSGKEIARYVDAIPTASLALAVSPAGDRLAIGVDAGDHGELRILDARTLAVQREIEVPLGHIGLGSFRADGGAFSILVSQPDRPADVFAVNPATGEVTPLRDDPRPGLASLPAIEASIQVVKAFDGLSLHINQYLPPHDAGARLPTVVIFHGGPSTSYAIRWNPYARFFVSLGYAVLEPNVRGSWGFGPAFEAADDREKRADWLRDLETVNAWTKAQAWCDPARVVVWGQSYGGYTTLMALTRQPTLWAAGVNLYGVSDLRAFLLGTDAAIRASFVDEFGDVDADAALLEEFSPLRKVDAIVRPLFVYQGANDVRVPRSESDAIVRALRQRGIPVEYMVSANEGHGVDHRENRIELMTRTARFLEDALR